MDALKASAVAVFVAIALTGLYLAWLSIAMGRSERTLDQLAAETHATDDTAWRHAAAAVDRVARLAAWDPAAQDLAARTWLLGAEKYAPSPTASIARLRAARSHMLKAIELRPSWPYSWLNLARIEFALDRSSAWAKHLARALSLNLRGTYLQLDLMRFRAVLGGSLRGTLASQVANSNAKGVLDEPYPLIQLAFALGKPEWSCEVGKSEASEAAAQIRHFCGLFYQR